MCAKLDWDSEDFTEIGFTFFCWGNESYDRALEAKASRHEKYNQGYEARPAKRFIETPAGTVVSRFLFSGSNQEILTWKQSNHETLK